jgi:hypothetical protein
MRKWIPFLFVLLAGCRSPKQPEIGMGDVHVPKVFHPNLGWIDRSPSHYERYLEMFRKGYWDCISKYMEDINYVPLKSDYYACGWLSEVAGYSDGYGAAEKDMERNIKRFGKARTAEYLKEVADGG